MHGLKLTQNFDKSGGVCFDIYGDSERRSRNVAHMESRLKFGGKSRISFDPQILTLPTTTTTIFKNFVLLVGVL